MSTQGSRKGQGRKGSAGGKGAAPAQTSRTSSGSQPAKGSGKKKRAKATPVLSVRGLTKRYGEHHVVSELDLDVARGRAVALVGRNGTGKSTVLRCVVGVEEPSDGTVSLEGSPLDERSAAVRARMAVVIDDIDFFPDLSVVEHLDLFAAAHGVARSQESVDEILHEVGLIAQSGQLPGTLSSGQKHRLGLASAFVRPRHLLVLDEPEQRLDREGLDWLTRRLHQEKKTGLAVLMASHDAALVESVADEVVDLGGGVQAEVETEPAP